MKRQRIVVRAIPAPVVVVGTIERLGPAPRSADDWYLVRPDDGASFQCLGGDIFEARGVVSYDSRHEQYDTFYDEATETWCVCGRSGCMSRYETHAEAICRADWLNVKAGVI